MDRVTGTDGAYVARLQSPSKDGRPSGRPVERDRARSTRLPPSGANGPPIIGVGGALRFFGACRHSLRAATAGRSTRRARRLDWRTGNRSVGAIDATIARPRSQQCPAPLAFVKELASVRRHRLDRPVSTLWAGQRRFSLHSPIAPMLRCAELSTRAGAPPRIGDGALPAAPSNPFRLRPMRVSARRPRLC